MAARWPSIPRDVLEIGALLPSVLVMRWFGVGGRLPWWLLYPLIVLGMAGNLPSVQRWLAGGDLSRRVGLRMGPHIVVATAVIYGMGWGPLIGVGYIMLAMPYLNRDGARYWRHAAGWSAAAICAGQAAIALGWIYCYLPTAYAQAFGFVGGAVSVLTIRTVGLGAEELERAEAAVRVSEERFRALVQDSHDVIAVAGPEGRLTYVSPAVTQVFGLDPAEMVGTTSADWVHPDDIVAARTVGLEAMTQPDRHHIVEFRVRRGDGSWCWAEASLRNMYDHPAVGGMVSNYRDITDRRAIQERLAYDANHDALTGLANRAAFLRNLERGTADATGVAVLFVDLDGFKQINDRLGHNAGDAMIVAAAAALRRGVLGSDLVGRLGGDEFGILLSDIDMPQQAVRVANRILAEMNHPIRLAGEDVQIRASIGIAVHRGDNAEELLHRADVAMYAAKRRQTHGYALSVDDQPDLPRVTTPATTGTV